MKKIDWNEVFIKTILITMYPIWLFFLLVDTTTWSGFKKGAKLPFTNWSVGNLNIKEVKK